MVRVACCLDEMPVVYWAPVEARGEGPDPFPGVPMKCLFFPEDDVCAQTFNESNGCPNTTLTSPAEYPAMALFRADLYVTAGLEDSPSESKGGSIVSLVVFMFVIIEYGETNDDDDDKLSVS